MIIVRELIYNKKNELEDLLNQTEDEVEIKSICLKIDLLNELLLEDEIKEIEKTILLKPLDIGNRKEVESLIRKNRNNVLENEERIVEKLYEGINIGLYRENELIGYILGSYDYEKELYYNEDVLSKVLETSGNESEVFIISDLLIDKKYRKKGYGSFLIESVLKESICKINLIMGRNQSNGRQWEAESIVDMLGFRRLCEVSNFWSRISIENEYDCKACEYVCRCEMLLRYINSPSKVKVKSTLKTKESKIELNY